MMVKAIHIGVMALVEQVDKAMKRGGRIESPKDKEQDQLKPFPEPEKRKGDDTSTRELWED